MAFILPEKVDFFPHPLMCDSDGLLAFGSEITPEKLLLSYQFGIFPWNGQDDPLLWWYTHPRLILIPCEVKISKSMRRYFNQDIFRCSFDQNFEQIIRQCRIKSRKGQDSTWITDDIESSFIELHKRGYAHSVEVWQDDKLVGGLYGLALGKIFCGESMFANVANASKYALINLCQIIDKMGFWFIDCQQETKHLSSLGAQLISKKQYFHKLKQNALLSTCKEKWT